jgi:glycosyltransferase involved in cell wall biosynthesis
MVLIDALHINNGGGKVLLDYLISENNLKVHSSIHYILDKRIINNHPKITNGTYEYLSSGLFTRLLFYIRKRRNFKSVFCFANIPVPIKLNIPVHTYFHQPLFLEIEKSLPINNRILLGLKIGVLRFSINNTNKWIVQSDLIKDKLSLKFNVLSEKISVIPFYPSFSKKYISYTRELIFLYVSNGELHKNHTRLLDAFVLFYDKMKIGELHLTVDKSYTYLYDRINFLINLGYPIVNHGFINHEKLSILYAKSKYLIFPSLTESFGLGIIEALESGCKIIGADRPYMYAICNPSFKFNPESVDDICNSLINSVNYQNLDSEQLVSNKIDEIISILNNS